jgi:hypothetical protein
MNRVSGLILCTALPDIPVAENPVFQDLARYLSQNGELSAAEIFTERSSGNREPNAHAGQSAILL